MDLQHVDEPIHVAAVKNLPRQLLHKQGSRKGSFPPAKLANTMPKECRSIEFEAHGTGAMAAELHTPVKRPQTLSAAPATLHGHWYRQHAQAPPCSRALDFSSPVHGECRRKFQDPLEDPQRAELQEFGAISNLVTPLFSPTTRPAGLNHHAGCSVPDTALLQKSFSFPLSPTHDKSWRDVSIEGVPNRKRCHVWPSSARQSYSEEDSQHILSNIDEDEGVDVDIDVNSQNPEEMFKFPISEDQLGNSLSDMTPMEVAEVIEDLLKEQLASTMCLQTALQRLTSACIEAQERFQAQFALLNELNSAMCNRSLAPALQILVQHARDAMKTDKFSCRKGGQSRKRPRTHDAHDNGDGDANPILT